MRILVLPGMGATSEMYTGPWHELPQAEFPDWPVYAGETSLEEVAARLVRELGITKSDFPIGSSLGGMVALEIGAMVGTPAVGLIGSARDRSEIHSLLTHVAPIASLVPVRLLQFLCGSSNGNLVQQFASADPDFIQVMCSALAEWQAPAFEGRIFRTHGQYDRVIPCPKDVEFIPDAGHFLPVTHPSECVEAVRRWVDER